MKEQELAEAVTAHDAFEAMDRREEAHRKEVSELCRKLRVVSRALEELTQASRMRVDELEDTLKAQTWSVGRSQHIVNQAARWARGEGS